jgi:hypothetical protein
MNCSDADSEEIFSLELTYFPNMNENKKLGTLSCELHFPSVLL